MARKPIIEMKLASISINNTINTKMKLLLLSYSLMACLFCNAAESKRQVPIEFGNSFVKSILECKIYDEITNIVQTLPKLKQSQKEEIIRSCLYKLDNKTSTPLASAATTNNLDLSFVGGRCLWLISHIINSPTPEMHANINAEAFGELRYVVIGKAESWSEKTRAKLAQEFVSRLDFNEKLKHASNIKTPKEIVELLAKDNDATIRMSALLSPSISDKTIWEMSKSDQDEAVRTKARDLSFFSRASNPDSIMNNAEWEHY